MWVLEKLQLSCPLAWPRSGPGKGVMVLGHAPQAGMHRHASRVLEMGRLKRDERNSWRKQAGKRRAMGLRRAGALGADWGRRCRAGGQGLCEQAKGGGGTALAHGTTCAGEPTPAPSPSCPAPPARGRRCGGGRGTGPVPPRLAPVTERCCGQDGAGRRVSASGDSGSAPGALPTSGRGGRRDEARSWSRLVVVRGAGKQTPWRGLSRSRS